MAEKDLPALIDFILDNTGLENISYVGHSEGTTQMFLAGSLMPEYFTPKINVYAALAPVATTANISNHYIRLAAKYIKEIQFVLMRKHIYNIIPPLPVADEVIDVVCELPFLKDVCLHIAGLLNHDGIDNGSRFDMYMSNLPSGVGYRTFVYYAQMINSGECTLYDYGSHENKKIYGTPTPPPVPFDFYEIPTALYSGDIDGLADPTDVAWLSQTLGDKVVFQKQYHLDHFSFVIAKDMSYFNDVVTVLQEYNPTTATTFLN